MSEATDTERDDFFVRQMLFIEDGQTLWQSLASPEEVIQQAQAINLMAHHGLPIGPDSGLRVYSGEEDARLLASMDLADAITDPTPLTTQTAETPLEREFAQYVDDEPHYRSTSDVPALERSDFAWQFIESLSPHAD